MGTAFLTAGKGQGSEKEEWHPTSVTLLPFQVASLTATSPMAIAAMGQPLHWSLDYIGRLAIREHRPWVLDIAENNISLRQ